jgi:uncharacterized protein (UPF0261 family)
VAGRAHVAVIATLDTKGLEAAFLREWFAARGHTARLVDVGIAGEPQCACGDGDVPAGEVAAAAGTTLDALTSARRDECMTTMGLGAGAILRRWAADGALAGAIGLGGNQGTAIACLALRSLPLGLPKVMVSTVASGNVRPYLAASDIAIVFSLADLLGGPNRITRGVLARAGGMLDGMISAPRGPVRAVSEAPAEAGTAPAEIAAAPRPAVALTTLGNTHAAAIRIMAALTAAGFEAVPFHASGAGGAAMERFIDEGAFAGVVDLTTHELLGEIFPEDIYAPAEGRRLVAAGRRGLAQVIAPGGLDYFIFGPPESVPPGRRGRPTHHHNPNNVNVRAEAGERAMAGRLLAERLNAAHGPSAFLYPLRGWSYIGREGGLMWDPEGAEAFRRSLRSVLRADRVHYREIDANINDPVFADEAVRTFLDLVRPPAERTT